MLLADVYLWQASGLTYPQDSITYDLAIKACDAAYNTDESAPSRPTGSTATYSFYAPWDGQGDYGSIFESGYESPQSEVIFALESNINTFGEQKSGAKNTGTYMAVNQLYGPVSTNGTRGDLSTTYLVAPNSNYPLTSSPSAANFTDVNSSVFKIQTATGGANDDKRYTYCAAEANNTYIINKYESLSGISNYPDWIFYRVADIYLMKAEALAEKMNCRYTKTIAENGNPSYTYPNYEAAVNAAMADPTVSLPTVNNAYCDTMKKVLELCKVVFDRANTSTWITAYENNANTSMQSGTPAEYFPNLVYAERRREFLFEGKRWFDLLRIARRDYKRDQATFSTNLVNAVRTKLDEGADLIASRLASMDALYWPIYEDELDRNTLLKQNAYYLSTAESDDMVIQ